MSTRVERGSNGEPHEPQPNGTHAGTLDANERRAAGPVRGFRPPVITEPGSAKGSRVGPEGIDFGLFGSGNDIHWYDTDLTMQHYVQRYLGELREWGEPRLRAMAEYAAGDMDRRARHTDREGQPRLVRYDKDGRDVSEIWYNEGYLATVAAGYGSGVVGLRYSPHDPGTGPVADAVRRAWQERAGGPPPAPDKVPFFYTQLLHMLMSMSEIGFTCPVTLTMSVAFVLEQFASPEQQRHYIPRLAATDPARLQQGGTFLTEIEGGSDVGAITTVAVPAGDHYLLTGEKWFTSNADAEIALVLARVGDVPGTAGLGLFVVPRTLPDGTRNRLTIRRLKDKLGTRAVPSGEIELHGAVGYPVGDLRRGFRYMAEALNVSRMCTATGSLALSRRAFLEAAVYTSRRIAFGRPLAEFGMVRQTLLDMITDIEAGWALAARMMLAFDRLYTYGTPRPHDELRRRQLLAMAKYRLSENGVIHARQALELHGGNGYVEDYVTARLLRDAQVNTVWEGASNIMALEVVKGLAREAAQAQQAPAPGRQAPESFLIGDVREALSRVTDQGLTEAAGVVAAQIPGINADIARVLTSPPDVQNALARRLLDKLTDLYSAAHLLEEAQYSLDTTGSTRLAAVARYYVDRTYRPQQLDIQGGHVPALDLFDVAVRYARS